MKNLMNNETMTLKEITDLLEVRHDNAMRAVERMATAPDFGTLLKIRSVYNDKGQTIETYSLDKRQSMAVAARLNTGLLMRVIDRWQELEEVVKTGNAELIMSNATRLLIETCIKSNTDMSLGDLIGMNESIEQLKLTK